MSDSTTLVERLRIYADLADEENWDSETPRMAAARIAELEDALRSDGGGNRYWEGRWRDAEARISELEAIAEQAAEALQPFARVLYLPENGYSPDDSIVINITVGDARRAVAALAAIRARPAP